MDRLKRASTLLLVLLPLAIAALTLGCGGTKEVTGDETGENEKYKQEEPAQ